MEESGLAQPLGRGKRCSLTPWQRHHGHRTSHSATRLQYRRMGQVWGIVPWISMYAIIITTTRSNSRNKCSITQDVEGTVEFIASKICTIWRPATDSLLASLFTNNNRFCPSNLLHRHLTFHLDLPPPTLLDLPYQQQTMGAVSFVDQDTWVFIFVIAMNDYVSNLPSKQQFLSCYYKT